ncbi:hypothetical protein DL239_15425 [Sedimentitalea sp. CY04]|uniref:VUT family protein n=1 Tax=Parasedimentitalea denitrificans TaxID=2211118 RepID=A0ABX0W9R3_9RHOB|nr:hypothetical protein [Sedimentitalea sp. CY04]NIZ62362.1 hypothetical protein [Sedimentitalea sp. CY04]
MSRFDYMVDFAKSFLIVVAVYVLCHGVTAFVVTPVQNLFFSDITVFASLIYLPHGVRVLATWLSGWKALFSLFAGAFLSELMFTPDPIFTFIEPVILWSIAVGAMSAYVSFIIMKFFGRDLYAGRDRAMNWKWLLIVGAVASVINSVGQIFVFSGLIVPDDLFAVLITYAVGDLVGLYVSMLVLMIVFRWIRLFADAK